MSNMSYCRFQNTLHDLRDCSDALEELLNGAVDEPLSREELAAAQQLVGQCAEIVAMVADYDGIAVDSTYEWADFEKHYENILVRVNGEVP